MHISEDYLGPAAPRFLSRLTTNHLGKPAAKLSRDDLPTLMIWIRLAATLITDNEALVNQYIQRLEKLSSSPHRNGVNGSSSPHAAKA